MRLIDNLSGYLLGMDKRQKWIVPRCAGDDVCTTDAITEYWRLRWMAGRLKNDQAIERLRGHRLVYPIKHGARVVLPRMLTDQAEMF